jgi:hypothetical protein
MKYESRSCMLPMKQWTKAAVLKSSSYICCHNWVSSQADQSEAVSCEEIIIFILPVLTRKLNSPVPRLLVTPLRYQHMNINTKFCFTS